MLTLSPSILRYTQNRLQKSISKNAKFNETVELPLSNSKAEAASNKLPIWEMMFGHWDVAQRATIQCLHIGSACLPVMLVLESRSLNKNLHAEKIHAGLFNNRHMRTLACSGEVGYRTGFVT
jgi:hypothetical protein